MATNLNFLITITLQPDGVNLRYLKLRSFDPTEFAYFEISKVYNIGLQRYRAGGQVIKSKNL